MDIYGLTTRFELNLTPSVNPITAANWAQKHRCPVIVTPPEHVAPLMVNRATKNAQYQIIVTLDFPSGKSYAMDKLRNASGDFSACDGCDILLSGGKSQVETKNEIKALYEFLKTIGMHEIRYVLGAYTRSRESIIDMLKGMKLYPGRWIRLDQHLTLPNITIEHHKGMIGLIKEHIATPLKISGNVDLDVVKEFSGTKHRFDVSLDQATSIVKHLEDANSKPELANAKQLS